MTTFAIASPYGTQYCYDYVVYLSLRKSIENEGLIYDQESKNRIYLLGFPRRKEYLSCGKFNPNYFNIGLLGSSIHLASPDDLAGFDYLFTSSPRSYKFMVEKYSRKPDGLWNLYSPFGEIDEQGTIGLKYGLGDTDFILTKKSIEIPELDIAFVGNARVRPAVESILNMLEKHRDLTFKYYGANINNYHGDARAKKYWAEEPLPYHQFPELARKAKVILMDMHDDMARLEMPSFKLIDMMMCKGFVLTYNNSYATQYLGGDTFNASNAEAKILRYLADPASMIRRVNQTYPLIKDVHSVKKTAEMLAGLIKSR